MISILQDDAVLFKQFIPRTLKRTPSDAKGGIFCFQAYAFGSFQSPFDGIARHRGDVAAYFAGTLDGAANRIAERGGRNGSDLTQASYNADDSSLGHRADLHADLVGRVDGPLHRVPSQPFYLGNDLPDPLPCSYRAPTVFLRASSIVCSTTSPPPLTVPVKPSLMALPTFPRSLSDISGGGLANRGVKG